MVGDLMLDRFVRGLIPRQSPEAPVPILLEGTVRETAGGAGVVATQLATLGADVALQGSVGDDEEGQSLLACLSRSRVRLEGVRVITDTETTTKTRYIGKGRHLLRVDRESPPEKISPEEACVCKEDDVLVLSDYGKGALSATSLQAHLEKARDWGIPTVADPKPPHRNRYRGCGVLTPNKKEAERLLGHPLLEGRVGGIKAATQLVEGLGIEAVVITLAAQGMAWARQDGETGSVSGKVHRLFDVTGAGDVVVSLLAAGFASGVKWEEMIRLANDAAGLSVTRPDTSILSVGDIGRLVLSPPRGFGAGQDEGKTRIEEWRKKGETIIFTNGCFDGLHAGHLSLLAQAASRGDRLIVGLNDDLSVRNLKGKGRPQNRMERRVEALCDIPFVDLVIPFGEETPATLLSTIDYPDILIKGGDYSPHEIVGAKETKAAGGRVETIPLLEGFSTRAFLG